MKYLDIEQSITALNLGKSIEHFLGLFANDGFETLRWIAIEKSKEGFDFIFHEVFDDSDDGIDSVYDFSYVEPNDIYGRKIMSFDSAQSAIKFAISEYTLVGDAFCFEGGMNDEFYNLKS